MPPKFPSVVESDEKCILWVHLNITGDLNNPSKKLDIHIIIDDGPKLIVSISDGSQSVNEKSRLLTLQLSSTIRIDIIRKSQLRALGVKHVEGHVLCKASDLVKQDKLINMNETKGTITVHLSLSSDHAKSIMEGVDARLAALDGNSRLNQVSDALSGVGHAAANLQSAAQSLGNVITPFGQALQLLVKIGDSIADAHPLLKTSWIILSSVYKAVKQQQMQDDNIRDLAEALREMLGVANVCADLKEIKDTTQVTESIGKTALDIAILIEESTRYSSLPLRIAQAQFKDLGSRVAQSKKECIDLMIKFDRRVHIENRDNLKELKDVALTEAEQAKKDKMFQWLDAPDPSSLCTTASEKHHPGSGSWFLSSPEYVKWKRNADIPLVIWGAPGFGKTVLCSTIVEDIKDHCSKPTSRSTYAYFFFDGRNSQTEFQHHGKAISSFIWQLCLRRPLIPSSLKWLYGTDLEREPKTVKRLQLALQKIIGEFNDDVYIIIDSLDECSERMALLAWIAELSRHKLGRLHLLVTSRPEHNIRPRLEAIHKISVDMEESRVYQDLKRFVDEKIQESFELRKLATLTDIGTAVMVDANGMFSLVAYRLEELVPCVSLADVKKKLKDLPKNLDDMYQRMINRLEPMHQYQVLLILQWLAFSMRALTLREIAEVILVNVSESKEVYFDADCRLTEPEDIFGICGGLVSGSQGEVKISHLSIKEYLLSKRRQLETSPLYLNACLAHSAIAQTCLVYLLELGSIDGQDEIQSKFPLASYAAHNWFIHATYRDEDGKPNDLRPDLILKLLVSNPDAFATSLKLHDPEVDIARSLPDSRRFLPGPITISPLYYSCLMGLTHVIQAIMSLGCPPVPQEPVIFGNSLQVAATCGNAEIVKVLLDNGVDPNIKGGYFDYALVAATWRKHTAVIQLLLERNADPNACKPCSTSHRGTSRNPLQIASMHGDMTVINLLLQHGVDIDASDADGVNTLEMLLELNWPSDAEIIQVLLRSGANPNHGGKGRALQAAVFNANLEHTELLLKYNADPNALGEFRDLGSVIHAACAGGNSKIIKMLLSMGAKNISSRLGKYGSVIQAATANCHFDIIKDLLEHGADPKIEGGNYEDIILSVAISGNVMVMQLLLEKGANPRTPGAQHALQVASANGNETIVELLLMYGADPNVHGSWFGTALQAASHGGFSTIVGLLLDYGANPNSYSPESSSPLYIAASEGYLTITQLLLEKGADPNTNGGPYRTALHVATERGHSKIVQLLLEKGSDPNMPGAVGHGNPIHIAATNGHETIVSLLLNNGADVQAKGARNAILVASAEGHANIVKLLLDKGANPNVQHGWYGTALQAACLGGFEDIVANLLENGANPNATGAGHHGNPLLAACFNGHLAIVNMLLKRGIDPNSQGGRYGNALQAAAANGQTAIAMFFLNRGSDPNRCGGCYNTALEAASHGGHRETVELLLWRGADPDIMGGSQRSALEAATLGGHIDIVRLLLAKGANPNIRGESILLTAVQSGDAELVKLLIRHQQTQERWQYETAMKAALPVGNKDIIGLLQARMGIQLSTQEGVRKDADSGAQNTCTDLIIVDQPFSLKKHVFP